MPEAKLISETLQAIKAAIETVDVHMNEDVYDELMELLDELDTNLAATNYTPSAEESERAAELFVAIGELTGEDIIEPDDDDDEDEDDLEKGVKVDDDDEPDGEV